MHSLYVNKLRSSTDDANILELEGSPEAFMKAKIIKKEVNQVKGLQSKYLLGCDWFQLLTSERQLMAYNV